MSSCQKGIFMRQKARKSIPKLFFYLQLWHCKSNNNHYYYNKLAIVYLKVSNVNRQYLYNDIF